MKYPEPSIRPTLGIVAISHNEEKDMPGFLEHLLPWVDEIVIVDDGSNDGTADIASSAGTKVKWSPRRRDANTGFAGQRNFSPPLKIKSSLFNIGQVYLLNQIYPSNTWELPWVFDRL